MPTIRTSKTRRNKHFVLDQAQLTRAKEILGARTETETIDRALEIAITETERDRLAWDAHDEFVMAGFKSGLVIEDVYGHLDDNP